MCRPLAKTPLSGRLIGEENANGQGGQTPPVEGGLFPAPMRRRDIYKLIGSLVIGVRRLRPGALDGAPKHPLAWFKL